MHLPYTITACTLSALLLAWIPAAAHDEEDQKRPGITVSGQATVTSKPDQALIHFGVLTQSEDARKAATENANRTDRVIRDLRKKFAQSAEIRTISYSVSPNYQYPKDGGDPRIVGYTASNTVEVKTSQLEQVGEMIDIATDAGSNNVQSLQFQLKDELPVRVEALRRATSQARAKADAIASAMGVRVSRVRMIQEGGEGPIPLQRMSMAKEAMAQDAATPVEPGAIEIQAMVTLTVDIE